jgi:hypothetical protein
MLQQRIESRTCGGRLFSFVMDWKKKASPVETWTPEWKAKAPA